MSEIKPTNERSARSSNLCIFRGRHWLLSLAVVLVVVGSIPLIISLDTPFPVDAGAKMGDKDVAIELTFHNSTTSVIIDLDFTAIGGDDRPVIDIRGHEPQGQRLVFNQTLGAGSNGWLVLSQFEPTVSGPAAEAYFDANSTLKLYGGSNGQVVLFFPIQGPASTLLPLVLVPIFMAFFPRKIPIAITIAVTLIVVVAVGIYG